MSNELVLTGEEDLLDLLDAAKCAMFEAAGPMTFVDVRPLQEEVVAAWLAVRIKTAVDAALKPMTELAERWSEDRYPGMVGIEKGIRNAIKQGRKEVGL